MEWNELSNEAKSVIEWVENPFTNKKEDVEIQVGVNFQRNVSAYLSEDSGEINIPMTMRLFSEIIKFVASDNNLETVSYDAEINRYVFRMNDSVKLH